MPFRYDDLFGPDDFSDKSSVTTKLPPARKATAGEERAATYRPDKNPQQLRNAPPRSLLEEFMDSMKEEFSPEGGGLNAIFHRVNQYAREEEVIRADAQARGMTPSQADAIVKQNLAQDAQSIRDLREQHALRNQDDSARGGHGVARGAARMAGKIVGDLNPTYALPVLGTTVPERIIGQGAVAGGGNMAAQASELHEGIRDEVDPYETLSAIAGGAAFQVPFEVGGKIASKVQLGRAIRRGTQHPDWAAVNDVIVNDLEGGGTLANPKTSKKGAMGPQQVMPATAKDPSFGIRPWNGKTQADLARVGRQYSAALMDHYNGDAEKVFAAYNGGYNRVDRLIKQHGEDWLKHMPAETRKYVQNGMKKIGPQGPEDLGTVDLVRGEQPSLRDQADINQRLAPSDELAADLPQNVVDLDNIRHAKDYQMASEQIDQIHDGASRLRDAAAYGSHPLDVDRTENTRSLINDELQNYEPGTSTHNKLLETDDMLKEAIAHSGVKPRIYAPDASEKFLSGEPSTDAANLNDTVSVDPSKTLHGYTDAEWHQLSKDQQNKITIENTSRMFPDLYPRDPNPPASSSTFGTKRPNQVNPRSSAPPKGEDHEDLKAVRSQKKLVLDRLGDLLDQSAPVRREAEDAISKERSRRLAAAMKAQKKSGGRQGLYEALGAMKGEMGRPRIQSIADQFTPEEINGLIDGVWNSPKLEGYEHIRAAKALDKLLGAQYGEIPTASEVALLSKAMPEKASVWRRLMENEEGSVPLPEEGAIKRGVVNVLGLTRTLKASFDVSAPGRQGMFLIGSKQYWKALPGMFKSFASEGKFHEMQEEIRNRPTYDLMNKAGLEITKNDGSIIDREEAFVSQFAEKIPGVRSSERAYLGFLNKLRADMFDDFVRRGDQLGLDFIHDPHYLKSAARFINAATGRGSVKWMGRNGELLSKALFSPKLMASRVQLLNPGFYAGLHPTVRAQAAKHGLIYASTVMTTLGVAAAAGAQVEWDPRSSDFAKIKLGNTRFDVTGGFQPYVRFYAQFLLGQQKGINDSVVRNVGWVPPVIRKYLPGEDQPAFKPTTRKDVVYRFVENKESPNASEITRLLQGSDAVGNPLTPQSEATNLFAPLIIQDTYQAYQDLGAKGLLTAIPNAVGVGIQTYTPKAKKSSGISGKDFGFSKSDFGGNTWSTKDFQ